MSQPPIPPGEQPPQHPVPQQPPRYPVPYQQQHPQNLPYPPPPYPVAVAPKNPGVALLASFFVPGLGSLMNGNVGMGVAIFVCYVVAWMSLIVLIGIVAIPAVWVWGMIDAYSGAKTWNRNHGIVS